jgi:hypothetical protein
MLTLLFPPPACESGNRAARDVAVGVDAVAGRDSDGVRVSVGVAPDGVAPPPRLGVKTLCERLIMLPLRGKLSGAGRTDMSRLTRLITS